MLSVRNAAVASLAVLALGLGAFGCGDDDEESADPAVEETTEATDSADAAEVTVTATEYDFELSATPTAETESVVVNNEGEEFHVLIFAKINEGFTLDEALEAEGEKGTTEEVGVVELPPGESSTIEVTDPIEPGSYAMLCPIGGPDGPHYELGQLEEFEIQ